jgi:hypothetical protein
MTPEGQTTGAKTAGEQNDDQAPRAALRSDFYLDKEAGSVEALEPRREVASDGR